MMKKRWMTLLFALLLLCAAPVSSASAANSVRVSLPDFPVTLNGQTFSNDYSKYPFLVYNDITYFPMTYNDCRLLGLRVAWAGLDILAVEKSSEPVSEYIREVQTSKNEKTQTAQIAPWNVTVNGKRIDSSREEYPLLVFRGVTYFPLTWRFAVEEFGWSCYFDAENGLDVSNPAARLTCTSAWEGDVSDYGGLMGTGNMNLACMFYAGSNGSEAAPKPYIYLYNITGADIAIQPSDFQWEYQLYRIIGGQDELVYRKAIPFFSGDLPNRHFAHWDISDTYDNWYRGDKSIGTYRAVLVHPAVITYQIAGTVLSEPTEGDGYAVQFSQEFTVS